MNEIKYTPSRHQLLREINSGSVRVYFGLGRSLVREGGEFLKGAQKRTADTLKSCWTWQRYTGMGTVSSAVLTESGRELLAAWDAKRPATN